MINQFGVSPHLSFFCQSHCVLKVTTIIRQSDRENEGVSLLLVETNLPLAHHLISYINLQPQPLVSLPPLSCSHTDRSSPER